MEDLFFHSDIRETKQLESSEFKNIKPEEGMTLTRAREIVINKYKSFLLNEVKESVEGDVPQVVKNKLDGVARELTVEHELEYKYPEKDGYRIIREAYLRDENGNIVKDPITGAARRIDFVVVKDGKVVDSIEVTSQSADKTEQCAKEDRIRDNGGNYIKDDNGNLVEFPSNIRTRIERRD